jgi:hypothetical protein
MTGKIEICKSEVAKWREQGFKVVEETAYFVYPVKMRRPPSHPITRKKGSPQNLVLKSTKANQDISGVMQEFAIKVVNVLVTPGASMHRDKLKAILGRDQDLKMKAPQTINARLSAMIKFGILEKTSNGTV